MTMIYGIPTLMEYSDNAVLFRFCAEQGYRFAEMNMTFPWFQPDVLSAAPLRALAKEYGIGLTIHLHDQVNPFEFSPEMRRAHLENVDFALGLAKALELPRLNMHLLPGTYSTINGVKTYLYAHCADRYLDYVRAFRDRVDRALAGTGTVFCIENTGGFRAFHHQAIGILLESPCFALTYDVGHDYRTGNQDEAFMLAHQDRIRHFHIHDCDSKANHLGLGEGNLDLPRYLKMARDLDATAVIEVKESGALIRSRAYLAEHGFWPA